MVTIDKAACQTLRDEINAALAAVAARHNIALRAGSCTFTANNATFKLEVAVTNPTTGVVESKERTDFKLYCHRYSLKETALGQSFTFGGRTFVVCGAKPKSWARPVLAKGVDGRVYKFSPAAVKATIAPAHAW